jgi:hypothetical protein
MFVRKEWNIMLHLTLWERNICEKEIRYQYKYICNFKINGSDALDLLDSDICE